MKSILDASFRYTPSDQTDERKTFAKIRREQLAQTGPEEERAQILRPAPVTTLVVRRPAQRQLGDRPLRRELSFAGREEGCSLYGR